MENEIAKSFNDTKCLYNVYAGNRENCKDIPASEYVYGYKRSECVEVKMSTDEMYPLIFKGDDITIHRQNELEPGEVGIFVINGKVYTRRVYYFSNEKKLLVIAENQNYDPLIFNETDLANSTIFGKIIASGRKINKKESDI